jgi:conserved oligomeric Golgi complex subunit 2
MTQNIYAGSLNTAHSPMLPQTPLHQTKNSLMSPRTPFTPFVMSKGNYFDSLQNSEPLLDDSDGDELASLLNTVLRFVQVNCTVILQLAEKAESRRKNADTLVLSKMVDNSSESGKIKEEGFEILANVIWDEISRSVSEELGSSIFSAGRPNDFHKVNDGSLRSSYFFFAKA